MLLRIGTTALVVSMIDLGLADAEAVSLADPLTALAVVAGDVTLNRPLNLACGGQIRRYRFSATTFQRPVYI